MKTYLYLLLNIGLLCSTASAEVMWQVYVTKNNDKNATAIAPGVEVSSVSVRIDLPGLPVKAIVEPEIKGTAPDGTPYNARLLAVEFLDGTGAAIGTVCASHNPGHGSASMIMIRRYNLLYQVDLTCLDIPEPK
jgi:hypothetical protein